MIWNPLSTTHRKCMQNFWSRKALCACADGLKSENWQVRNFDWHRSNFFRLRLRSCSKIFESGFRQFFKVENPTPVKTPAPTIIYQCFYLRNDHIDSCSFRNWKVTPDPVSPKFLTPGLKEKRRIPPESTPTLRVRTHFWYQHLIQQSFFYEIQSGRVPVLNCKMRLNCDPKTGSCSTLPRDRNQRSGLKPILVDQDKIGLQFLLKIGGSGLIRSEKFVLIKCDYSTHMKIFRLCLLCCQRQKICWGCSGIRTVSSLVQIYWRVRDTSSTVNLAEKEV